VRNHRIDVKRCGPKTTASAMRMTPQKRLSIENAMLSNTSLNLILDVFEER